MLVRYGNAAKHLLGIPELNEVPWEILDDYVAARPASALARVLAGSHRYVDDRRPGPPVAVDDLADAAPRRQRRAAHDLQLRPGPQRRRPAVPPIWSLLHDAGVSVGVCGTLHSYPAPDDLDGYAFPCPTRSPPSRWPTRPELVDFQRFNLAMSRESARNVDTGIAKKDALEVVRHSRRRDPPGLRRAGQAAAGRAAPAGMTNRRRTFQSVLLFDIFAHQLRRSRPRFSTFFTNHVASAMHRYWAAYRPGDYQRLGLGQDWVETFRDEVMWATGQAADMIGRLAGQVDANPGAQLWIASSMGQRATMAETLETQVYLTHPAPSSRP